MHWIDGIEQEVTQGQLHWISPRQVHGFRPLPKSGFRLVNVALIDELVEPFLGRHAEQTTLLEAWRLQEHRCDALVPREWDEFARLIHSLSIGGRSKLEGEYFLCALTRLLYRPGHQKESAAGPEWLQLALPVAAEPENLREGFSALVRLCGRTPEHVCRSFKKHLGQMPSEWINAKRIERARFLLETAENSIQDVAFDTGFENLSHFHRTFKQHTGKTPGSYRRQHQMTLF